MDNQEETQHIKRDNRNRFLKGVTNGRQGKTNIEIFGLKEASKISKKISEKRLGKTCEEIMGEEKGKEYRKKVSERVTGEGNPFYNKKHTEENKKIIGNSKIGKPSWNAGLTKETSESVRIGTEKSGKTYKKLYKEGKILKRIGELNPMYHQEVLQGTRDKISKKSKETWNKPEYRQFARERIAKRITPIKDTKIEVKIQEFLTALHIEYIAHKYISEISHSYRCDMFIPEQETEGVIITQKTIIEADGCFFHCCPICKRKEFPWTKKRKELDKIRTQELIEKGFKVIRIFEHEIKLMKLNEFKEKLNAI